MVSKNYLEEEFRSQTLFTDESVFEPEFVPKTIKHRENELVFLSRLFLPIITRPFVFSKKILVTGNVGVGKTVTVRYFGKMMLESAKKRELNIKFVHLNCRYNKTSSNILKRIINELIGSIPPRGLSIQDFLEILVEYLQDNHCYLILVLDELGSLMKKDSDLIYTLSRINELKFSNSAHISLIGIVKNLLALKNLDEATISTLQNEVIRFKKYTKNQISDILNDRIAHGLKPGIIDNSVVKIISSLTSVSGDMRRALKILRNSVRYAEHHKYLQITPEIIQNINSEFIPFSLKDLGNLKRRTLLLYKAICNILTSPDSKVAISEIKEEYYRVCEEYSAKPRSDTQIWEYIQVLKRNDLITTTIQNKNQHGRQSYIQIPNYPVKPVLKGIEQFLRLGE